MSSLKQKAISGAIWSGAQQFGIVGIRFFAQILLARIISPDDFGLFGLIVIFNAIGNTISDSGMGQSLIRSDNLTEKDYGTVFLMNLGVSVIIYFIIFLIAPYIAEFYDRPILKGLIRLYSIAIIFSSFSTIQIYRLSKLLKFKEQTLVQLPSVLISAVVGITLGYLDFKVWALVWMEVTRVGLAAIQFWILTNWRPQLIFDTPSFKRHFNFGYKLLLAGLLDSIEKNIYPMVIGKYNPVKEVGYFNRASSLKDIPVTSIMGAMGKVTYPILSEVKNDHKRLKSAYKKMLQIALLVIAPMMFLLVLIAKPLIIFLITDKWLPAVPYFQLLCLTGILYPLHVYNLNIIKVQGRSDLFLKAEIFKKIVSLIIISITAPFGITMIIYGLLVANLIGLLINQYFSSLVFNYSNLEQSIDSIKIVWPALFLCVIFWFVSQSIEYSPTSLNYLLHISTTAIIFITCYLILQFLFNKSIFNEFKEILSSFRTKKKNLKK